MTDTLTHRGPDDAGFWHDDRISLGMRRLAIVDLETGLQPMWNEDDTVGVVFNGEIYNFPELRDELTRLGHRFRSHHSDTEVLVHLYEEYGAEFPNRLNGMFAIALWDSRRQELHLIRDRAGIKPLYYCQLPGRVVFGSEIKALLAHPDVPCQPNFLALHHYFSLKNIPAPLSVFAGVEQLCPGECAVFRNGELKKHRWWMLNFSEDATMDLQEAAEGIREILEDSVRIRMRVDVPFGAYLSGGIDSSSVVALMSRIGGQKVKTFSLVYEDEFENKEADRRYARLMSSIYGTEHHEYVLSHGEVLGNIEEVLQAFDEPFSGVTSTYFITKLIAKHVKVALSGDGADELFGSYLPHRIARPLFDYGSMRDRLSDITADERLRLGPFADQLDYLESIYSRGDEASQRMALYLCDDTEKQQLYSSRMTAEVGGVRTEDLIRSLYARAGTRDQLNRALYVDFESLLPDQVLAFVDRLSMAHSVEVRPPFLDYRMMEYAARIPGSLKIRGSCVKHVLKEAVRDLLPQEIIERPKEGFVLPINNWLIDEMADAARSWLRRDRIASHGLLRAEVVNELIDDHVQRRRNNGARIWNLIMFQAWWERFFGV
jgi:asparagine synthase (glutamine-hydrolysing)